jgi:hypothetical protein
VALAAADCLPDGSTGVIPACIDVDGVSVQARQWLTYLIAAVFPNPTNTYRTPRIPGALPPTAGDALVHGESLCGEGGLDRVRSLMGVCPQFDVLWNELSGVEHLTIYGHIKGLKFSEVRVRQCMCLSVSAHVSEKERARARSCACVCVCVCVCV